MMATSSKVLSNGAKKIDVVYELPLLAHATMEPMNITIHARGSEAEVWAPTQSPDWVQGTVAQVLGLKPEKVVVHTTFMGGGFGRRYMADFPARSGADCEAGRQASATGVVARR